MRPMRIAAGAAALCLLAGAARAAEGGMPQLDFGNPLTTAQVVWLAVIFVALYLVMSRSALPQVAAVLELRAARIAQDLDTARAAKSEADAAVAELERATREAHASAQAAIAQAIAEAKEVAAKHSAELEQRLEAQIAEAETRIYAARQAALGALEQVATDTAQAIVGRLTNLQADEATVRRGVERAVAAWRASDAQAA